MVRAQAYPRMLQSARVLSDRHGGTKKATPRVALNGGGGGSRTRVFLSLRHIFYMLSVIVDLDRVWECAPVRPIFILTYPGDRN